MSPSPPSHDSDSSVRLLARIARKDDSALTELHGRWSPVLSGIAGRMLGSQREAEKAVEDTFVHLWEHAGDDDSRQAPPFVRCFSLLRDLCINRLRQSSKRDSTRPADTSTGKTPDPSVMAADEWRDVRSTLARLSKDEHGCIELAVFLGYAQSAASSHSRTPLGAVKNRLRHALEKLAPHSHAHPDPLFRETAAWRAFGMLDTSETARFDDAVARDPGSRTAWQEMNRLTAALAIATAAPASPSPKQLARVRQRLGLAVPPRAWNWAAITGWATAAVLAVLLVSTWISPRHPAASVTSHLWVVPQEGAKPVHLGSLPDSAPRDSASFDFNPPGRTPVRLILTRNAGEVPEKPPAPR
jgi:RNA polymerase sigma-70 factor (ECF subfamily)